MAKKPSTKVTKKTTAELRRLAGMLDAEAANGPSCTVTLTGLSTTCLGCTGRKLQERNDGVKVLCPVCGGSGTMPTIPAAEPWTPWTPWPGYEPYPWNNPGTGTTKPGWPLPAQIID